MFCGKCGKQIPDDSAFCPYCGSNTSQSAPAASEEEKIIPENVESNVAKPKSKLPLIIGIVVLLVASMVGAYIFLTPMLQYKRGVAAMQNEDWDLAISCFSELDYQDSNDLLTECMLHQKSDFSFIKALEKSLTERLGCAPETPYDAAVDSELRILEEFDQKEFYDSTIKKCAKDYIAGLKKQRNAISYYTDTGEAYDGDHVAWSEGAYERYQAAEKLLDYSQYFFADDAEMQSTIRNTEKWCAAQAKINKEVQRQLIGVTAEYSKEEKCNYLEYKNNTEYAFYLYVINSYESSKGVTFDEHTVEMLKPGQTTTILLKNMPKSFDGWYTDWFVGDVYHNGILLE